MNVIDLTGLQPVLNELVFAALTALASFVATKLCQWLKAKRDGELGQIVDKALAMGIAFAMSRLTALEKDHLTFEVRSALAADAANYVAVHVPDAMKALGLEGDHLVRMIEARLPGMQSARVAE